MEILVPVITENEFKKYINVDDMPSKFIRKREEERYIRLAKYLSGIKDKIKLEFNEEYWVVYYEGVNIGSGKFSHMVKRIYDNERVFTRETDQFYVCVGQANIGKRNIMAVIGDIKTIAKGHIRKQINTKQDNDDLKDMNDILSKR